MPLTLRRVLRIALPVLIVGYAALLRFDALTQSYGAVTSPTWLRAVQERSAASLRSLRPAGLEWAPVPTFPHRDKHETHYISDPYTYLIFAREMQAFSAAHYREPLFPFVTKIFLTLLHDQDVAVSFASASFSVLAVLATYLLGTQLFSRAVGAGAALALAIEYDVISLGIGGWRDDAFTAAVVLCAYAMVRYAHVPSRANAIVAGVFAGLACLIRITALSFVVPGLAYLGLAATRPWRARTIDLGLAALVASAIVGPYAFNCWRVFGDPLYAINYHTGNYLAVEGQAADWLGAGVSNRGAPLDIGVPVPLLPESSEPPTAVSYVLSKARSRPFQTLDTIATGLTTYPFRNKWNGFDRWNASLGTWLSWVSLAGLVLFAGSPAGRLTLVVLVTSLLPFAPTWKLIADWRFTEHVYPLYLIAACAAVGRAVTAVAAIVERRRPQWHRPSRKTVVFWTTVCASAAFGRWAVLEGMPTAVARESLQAHDEVTIVAGDRDGGFFGEGWSNPVASGNVTWRFGRGTRSVLSIPLPRVDDYFATLRVDPVPAPAAGQPVRRPVLRVLLNGTPIAVLELKSTPGRVGAFDLKLPRHRVRRGSNRLLLAVDGPAAGVTDAGFGLWYVRIRPSTIRAVPSPAMSLDTPRSGAIVSSGRQLPVGGWAIDRGDSAGPGVTAVNIHAYPIVHDALGPGVFLGAATLGIPRPDVAAAFGERFAKAGFMLEAPALNPGTYRLVAFASSAVAGTFNQSQFADITVTPPASEPLMSVDAPAPGPCAQPCAVAGWAIDLGAASGTGVDAVRVTAYPSGGAGAIELGTAAYGGVRPDVGAAYGGRFTNSGYQFVVTGLTRGRRYEIRVSGRSVLTGSFNQSKSVTVTIQ